MTKKTYLLRVNLNGTNVNPWNRMGLKQNPFPQLGKAEYDKFCLILQELGGPPIPHDRYKEYIRETLKGFDEEFIELCIQNFKPGEMSRFTVAWKEEE